MWNKRVVVLLLVFFVFAPKVKAQQELPLYTGIIPNSKNCTIKEVRETSLNGRLLVKKVTVPTLTAFKPEKSNGTKLAVIICPGGGYSNLSIGDGGMETAKELAKQGVYAFVLKYRLADSNCNSNSSLVPLQDVQQAIYLLRKNAEKFDINPKQIGLLGFSAGGHLVSMAATHSDVPQIANSGISLAPNFTIFAYPVISFTAALTSKTSKTAINLLGLSPSQKQIAWFSAELNVTAQTPPSFIIHAADDSTALVENSISYFSALHKYQIPSELYVYQKGGHGFANYNKLANDYWLPRALKWMKLNGYMK